jgi:hypothetical protein
MGLRHFKIEKRCGTLNNGIAGAGKQREVCAARARG